MAERGDPLGGADRPEGEDALGGEPEPQTSDPAGAGSTRARVRWSEIAESAEFVRLESLRRRVMLVMLAIFGVIFGTFLVLSGYARPFMRKSVDGGLTVAYVWILALTVLAWVLVAVYLRFARRFEAMGEQVLERGGYASAYRQEEAR